MQQQLVPLNFNKWLKENSHLLKPPVGNKLLWEDTEFMVFAVAGPNQRTDFHVNPSEEFFYQYKGRAFLRIKTTDDFYDLVLNEGDMFLMPPNTPHSPQRPSDTIGLVIERKRKMEERDSLIWWCPKCKEKIHGESFHLKNIVTDFKPIFEKVFSDKKFCTCKKCGFELTRESRFFDMHVEN